MPKTGLVTALKKVLSNTYVLYAKTQNYHWNVTGQNFLTLHTLFEDQYKDLAAAIDNIAELIRILGEKTPGTLKFYINHTSIFEGNENLSPSEMVKDLLSSQDSILSVLRSAFEEAEKTSDSVIADAMVERMAIHRKNKWILESVST